MSFLYVNEERAKLSFESSKLVVDGKDLKRTIPIESITGVVLFGNITITTPCITELMIRGISVVWLSKRGKFFGRLESTGHINILLQRSQFRLGENEEFCLGLSKRFIDAKINNQKVFLRRILRSKGSSLELKSSIDDIDNTHSNLHKATNTNELMGYEGMASRVYFKALSAVSPDEYKFTGRSKRPPKDKFNSLLSFGYTLLMYEIYSAIQAKGLNPYAAFMHKDKRNHPALASDLMEEWRTPLIDTLVFDLVNRDFFKDDEFEKNDDSGVFLVKNGVRKFIGEYEKKLATRTKYLSYIESPVSFREGIHHQIAGISKAISENNPEHYQPIAIR